MKKLLMLACALIVSAAMFAQQGDKSVGINIKYGLDDPKSTGFGIKGQYGITDPIRIEGSFNYFLKKDYLTMLDVNVNLHYVFTFGEFGVYPLAGVTLQNARVSGVPGGGSHSESKFGLNLGAGAEYPITEKIKVNLEFTYKLVNDYDRSLIGLGVAYKF